MNSSLEQKIKDQFGEIVYKFPILHHNWECDGYGYIVERQGERNIVLSNHSNFYIASIKELELKLAEYTKIKFETKKAITLIKTYGKLD